MPFRRRKGRDERKQALKEGIGNELALKHKAQSRIRAADLEFERAFAEVMGLGGEEKKAPKKPFKEPKRVVVVGKKPKKEKSKKEEIRRLLKKEKLGQPREVKPKQKPEKAKQKKKPKKKKKGKPKREKVMPSSEKKQVSASVKKKSVAGQGQKKQEVAPAKEKNTIPTSQKKQKAVPVKVAIPKSPEKEKMARKLEGWATFSFWYSDKKASSLQEFKQAISTISEQSLEHHAEHNDFSKYLGEFYDKSIASKVEALERTLRGNELRKRILAEL